MLQRARSPPTTVPCVDLFSSVGGWSTGATQAGHHVVLAVDCDPIALQSHALNHPTARHAVMVLGPETEEALVDLIDACVDRSRPWHLHGSPPCTLLSPMQRAATAKLQTAPADVEANTAKGLALVHWFLALVRRLRPTMFTFEQVNHPAIRSHLDELKRQRPGSFDYRVTHFQDFGVPQERTRLIGGTPVLIDRLRHDPALRAPHVPIREAFAVPNRAAHVRSACFGRKVDEALTIDHGDGTYSNARAEERQRTLDKLCWTLPCTAAPTWTDAQYRCVRQFTIAECKVLQTFPVDYRLAGTKKDQLRGVGNAVPCAFARLLMSDYRLEPPC